MRELNGVTSCWLIQPAFALAGSPPSPRSGHATAAVGNWLIIYGGWDGDRHLVDLHLLVRPTQFIFLLVCYHSYSYLTYALFAA